jgi:hypothetical protein
MADKLIINYRLPHYDTSASDWERWRLTYEGGPGFRRQYLQMFSSREDSKEFNERLSMTPIPSFAKAAINDVRNSIFQRMVDIVRKEGSQAYHRAVDGFDMGVDRRGSSMNAFIGRKVLEELLVMGQVGIFVDAPPLQGNTLADVDGHRPYVYAYPVERILSYACTSQEEPSEFSAVLLEDTILTFDELTRLPQEEVKRYRHLWISEETGKVNVQFYNADGDKVDRDGNPDGPVELELTRIPFILLDIGDSLLKDVCEYQIALLNLVSSDVSYALSSNFPFYTEQVANRNFGSHLKHGANPDGTATTGGQGAQDTEHKVGIRQGRSYPKDMDRPDFIHPSSEPLKASMALQEKLEADIRRLINLAVQTLASRESAESKSMDNAGLEAGLSFIGLVIEAGERLIAEYWAAYEESSPSRRKIPVIKYPDRYSLQSDSDRIDQASKLSDVITDTPSNSARKELWKTVAQTLLGGRVNPDTMLTIAKEIDQADYTTANPKVILEANEGGLVGDQLASIALGFPANEYLKAREDHSARVARIAAQQGGLGDDNPAARGVDDLDDDPNAGQDEKTASRDTTLSDSTKDRTRGDGKDNQPEE